MGALVLWVGSSEVTVVHATSHHPGSLRHAAKYGSPPASGYPAALHRSRRSLRAPASGGRRTHGTKPKPRRDAHSPATPGVAYRKQAVGSVTAHIVQVDLNRADVQVTVGVANGGIGRCETWSRIIGRLRPTAAITGTYYDPATFIPVGTIIANGIGVHQGMIGTALTFSGDNRARFIRGRLPLSTMGLATVLRAGPRLVDQGRVSLMPSVEGFRDPSIFVRKPRAAVGLTGQNKLLLVTVTKPVYLREMARVMLSLGAYNAMCMDGGSSAGLYYAGKSYQVPRRVMTNVLMVYARPRVLRKTVGSG